MQRRSDQNAKSDKAASQVNKRRKSSSTPIRFCAEPLESRVLLNSATARLTPGKATKGVTLAPALQAPTAPYIVSINRQSPGTVTTGASSVQFLATFSQSVTGVDASDFAISSDSAVAVANPLALTPVTASTYDITLSGIRGSGDVSVKFVDNHDIVNGAGQHLVSMSVTNVLSAPQASVFPAYGQSPADVVPDLNGDRTSDFVSPDGSGVDVYFADGLGHFNLSNYLAVQVAYGVPVVAFTTGDVNGDHVPDVVTLYNDGSIACFLGAGNGSFGAGSVTTTSISAPSGVSLADFNGDGHSDLLIASGTGNDIVELGNGSRTFNYSSTFSLGQVTSVTPADFNGDNSADLFFTNSSSATIRMNDGSGNFGPPISVTRPSGLFAGPADFNADGKLDFAYADTDGTVHILTGNGNGLFAASTSFTSLPDPYALSALDVNGDGAPDLVLVGDSTLQVALNNGSGQFQSARAIASNFNEEHFQSLDIDGDGHADLLATANNERRAVLYGVANVSFASQSYIIAQPAPQVLSLQPSAGIAPLNATFISYTLSFSQAVSGVNATEFRTTTQGAITVGGPITVTPLSASVYTVTVSGIHGEGTVNLSFSDTTGVHNALGQTLAGPLPGFSQSNVVPADFTPKFLVDIDADGNLDLIGTGRTTGAVEIAYGNGDGTFQSPLRPSGATQTFGVTAIGDVTGDGFADLVGTDGGTLEVLPNSGHGNFGSPIVLGKISLYSPDIGDFNNDRIPDIVANTGGSFVTFLGNGGGSFRQGPTSVIGDRLGYTLADVNLDGSLDEVSLDYDGNPEVILGNGDGSFSKLIDASTTTTTYAPPILADANNDGLLDDIYADNHILGYRPGLGDGTFGSFVALDYSTAYPTVRAGADFNEDGALDVLTQTDVADFVLYSGNPANSASQVITLGGATAFNSNVLVGDINHDGRPDWIVASASSGATAGYIVETNTSTMSYSAAAVSVEQTYPHVASIVKNSSQPIAGEMDYTLTFSEAVTGVSSAAFSAVLNGSATAGPIVVTAQTASVYTVAVKNVGGSGTIALSFNDANVIHTAAGNPLISHDTDNAFTPRNVTGVGSQGLVATGDFNGDGKADLVASSIFISSATGNGDGTFQPAAQVGLYGISRLITIDANGDGKLDLICAGSVILIALGKGDGTFGSFTSIDSSSGWSDCDVADINGDGQPDVIAISASQHQIASFLGVGNGTFSTPIVTSLSSATPSSISVGDVNGDGIPDALATCQGVGAYILVGNRDGTFTVPATPFLSDADVQLGRLADFNADQKLDAIVSDGSGSHVLLGDGAGSFGTDHPFAASFFSGSIPVADVNGDGFLDLLTPSFFTGTRIVYLGRGDGSFQNPVVDSTPFYCNAVAVADFNGDGRPDIFTADFFRSGDAIFLARNGSTITAPSIVGSVSQASVISTTASGITLAQDADGTHIDWTSGSQVGQVAIDAAQGLTINATATMTNLQLNLAGGNPLPHALHLNGTFTLNGLTGSSPLAGTTLDIKKSTVFLSYGAPASDAAAMANVLSYLKTGYNSGAWTGTSASGSILSSAAAANANQTTAIGYADSSDGSGVNTTPNTIELKYTLYADTALAGTVGFNDFAKLGQTYGNNTGGTWNTGDWNYDGSVNFLDFNLLGRTYGSPLGSQSATPAATPAAPSSAANSTNSSMPTSQNSVSITSAVATGGADSSTTKKKAPKKSVTVTTKAPASKTSKKSGK